MLERRGEEKRREERRGEERRGEEERRRGGEEERRRGGEEGDIPFLSNTLLIIGGAVAPSLKYKGEEEGEGEGAGEMIPSAIP